MKKIKFNFKFLWISIAIVVALCILVVFPIFKQIISIIVVSFIITYTLRPLKKFLMNRGINKKLSALIIILGVLIILGGMIGVIIPWIYSESTSLTKAIAEIQDFFKKISQGVSNATNLSFVQEFVHNSYEKVKIVMRNLTNTFILEILSVAENLFLIIIIPTIVYFFLSDGENILGAMMKYFPVHNKYAIKNIGKHIDKVMERYIITQFQLCGIIGILTLIVLLVAKVKYAFILSIVNAAFNIIPYFGPVIGAVPIILITLLTSTKKAIIVTVCLVVIQQVEGDIICPKVIGETVNCHPITILLLLIIGGSIGGIFGMILVIPIWTMIKIIITEIEGYLF